MPTVDSTLKNLDPATVEGFGKQWKKFDQSVMPEKDIQDEFDGYFEIFRWDLVNEKSVGFDMGCGTGRWAKLVAPRVGHLNCIEPSEALDVARAKLAEFSNVSFYQAGVGNPPLPDESQDFGYILGVLHYVPDAAAGLKECVKMLKPGAPILVYIYYRFDNKPLWFRSIWQASDVVRRGISRMPFRLRGLTTDAVAALVYWPLGRLSRGLEKLGMDVSNVPLSAHRNDTFYYMRTLSMDRLGSRIEHRYTKKEIEKMLVDAGCEQIRFSDRTYWCAVAVKKK